VVELCCVLSVSLFQVPVSRYCCLFVCVIVSVYCTVLLVQSLFNVLHILEIKAAFVLLLVGLLMGLDACVESSY